MVESFLSSSAKQFVAVDEFDGNLVRCVVENIYLHGGGSEVLKSDYFWYFVVQNAGPEVVSVRFPQVDLGAVNVDRCQKPAIGRNSEILNVPGTVVSVLSSG